MKKQIVTAILLLVTYAVSAQEPPKPPSIEERLSKTKEVLAKEVKLSSAQVQAMEAAFRAFFIAADQLRKDNPPPPPPPPDPKVKAAMDKLVMDRDEAMEKVLTPDQYEKYKAAAIKLHPPRPGEKGNGGPPPPVN